jgi:hypothetical protein
MREEIFLIAREALGSAFRHSGAREVEAKVTYDDAVFHLRIRGNGQGISPSLVKAGGRSGHFGWSKLDAGTVIHFRMPARRRTGDRRQRFTRPLRGS